MFVLNGNGAKVIDVMGRLGLTTYQSRAYFTLLLCGEMKGGVIARLSGVPQSRIYATLQSLLDEGLVEVTNTTPKMYRPKVSLRNMVKSYVDERRDDIDYARKAELWLGNIASKITPLARKYQEKRIRIFQPTYVRG